jgi:rRNA maturation RNase YbeY
MEIEVVVRDGITAPLTPAECTSVLQTALEAAGAPAGGMVTLTLSDDAELAALNETHIGKDGPTDVLSFPLLPPSAYPPHEGQDGAVRGASDARPGMTTLPGTEAEPGAEPETGAEAEPGQIVRPGTEGTDATEASAFVLPPGMAPHLGDIVVSVERAIVQAETGSGGHAGDVRWDPADELRLLITHGALHLCGWDHATPDEEAAMRALERRLLGHPEPET